MRRQLTVAVFPSDPDEITTHVKLTLVMVDGLTANFSIEPLCMTQRLPGSEYLPLSQYPEFADLYDGCGWDIAAVQALTEGWLQAREDKRVEERQYQHLEEWFKQHRWNRQ